MAGVGYDGGAVVQTFRVDAAGEKPFDSVDMVAVFGGYAEYRPRIKGLNLRVGKGGRLFGVAFVYDDCKPLAVVKSDGVDYGSHACRAEFLRFCYVQDDTSFGQDFVGTFDTHSFQHIVAFTDTGRIDEAETDSIQRDVFGYDVPGGTGYVRYQGAFFAEQTVEQRRFAHVGTACYRDGDTFPNGIAEQEGVGQFRYVIRGPVEQFPQGGTVGECDIFFREIEFQFEQ